MNKRSLVWIATIGTMVVMVAIWASVLPNTIEVTSSDNDEIANFTSDINTSFDELQKSFENAGNVLGETATTESEETMVESEVKLSDEQIEKIKQQLESENSNVTNEAEE